MEAVQDHIKYLKGRRKVFFVGAGISVNPPTCFPVAWTLTSHLLRAIAPDEQSLEVLTELSDAGRADKRNPGDYIRFELLLDVIQLLADRELSLLKFIDIFDEPNALHYLLAERAMAGDVVITTNFDGLIEEAIRRLGGEPLSLCTASDFADWDQLPSPNQTPIYKVHGSYRRYDGSASTLTLESVQATLSTLTAGAAELVLPEAKRNFLLNITRGNLIVITGYSGRDDLDVVPTFRLLSPHSFLWLSHNNSLSEPRDVTEQTFNLLKDKSDSDLLSRELFFKTQLLKNSYPLRVYEVNTPSFLVEEFDGKSQAALCAADELSDVRLTAFIKDWQAKCLSEPYVKHLIHGHLLFSLSRFKESYQSYLKAWSIREPDTPPGETANIARMISRIAVEIGLFKEAGEWGKKALTGALGVGSHASVAQSLHQYGYAQYKLGNFEEALSSYEKAAAICKSHELDRCLSDVLHDTALIHQNLSRLREAISLYEESIALSTKDGDIRHVAFSLHQLGTAHYDLGQFSKSKEYHLKAAEMAAVIGDYAQMDNSEHELGMLDFLSGKIVDSIRRFRRGIDMASKTGRSEFMPMDLQHIGIALMESGKLKAAARFLFAANEGYEAMGDEFTLSELQSYISENYLLQGDWVRALEAARAGLELASRKGSREYGTRADFMSGLAEYLSGDRTGGGRKMCHTILVAQEEGFMALTLDQIYLCARFNVEEINCPGITELVRWALATYSDLGNLVRSQKINSFLQVLEKISSTKQGAQS